MSADRHRPAPARPGRRRGRRCDGDARSATPSSGAARSRSRRSAMLRGPRSPMSGPAATTPVRDANARVGGGRPDGRLVLDPDDLRAARDALEPRVRRALDQAIANVRRFAETQRPTSTRTTILPGIEIERRWTPLAAVGAYVPGGSAPYPSSLVMTVVPAQVAGVERIVVASPADRDGAQPPGPARRGGPARGRRARRRRRRPGHRRARLRPPATPASRRSTGSSGPGNAWVTAAKIEVCGDVGIDLPGRPVRGHGPRRAAGRSPSRGRGPHHAGRARPGLAGHPRHDRRRLRRRASRPRSPRLLATAARRDILERALREHGRIVLAPTLDAAIAFVDAYAPEHLSVDVEPLEPTVARLRNAGSLFVGRGRPNRPATTPRARTTSCRPAGSRVAPAALSVESYGKFVQVQRVDRAGLAAIRESVATLAEAEGLLAHRDAVEIRFEAEPMKDDARDVHVPDRARLVQLGGHERGGRRAVRHPDRADRPLRPEHLPHPAGPRRARCSRRAVRDRALRVPAVRLPPARRRPRPRGTASAPTRSSSARARTRSST